MTIILKDGEYFETKEVLIDVAGLEADKAKFEAAIADAPILKTKPDTETLELWNSLNSRPTEQLEKRIADIDAKLASLPKEISTK